MFQKCTSSNTILYSQIERSMRAAKLSCTSCSVSGDNTLSFDKPRKIPLLSDVFDAVKNDDLVMYLNVS